MFSVGGLLYAVLYPRLNTDKNHDKRLGSVMSGHNTVKHETSHRADGDARRKTVQNQLKALEEKQEARRKKSTKPAYSDWMSQAGLGWSKQKFYAVSALVAVVFFLVAHFTGQHLIIKIGALFVGGFGAPRVFVSHRRKKRLAAFLEEFPNAVDVIVRGVKAGLPLNDCIRIIASEAKEPVASEFFRMSEAQGLGIHISEAAQNLASRIPLPEVNFFSIVVAIQSQSGGSLSEALGNLSKVLRDRKAMKGKIKAVSSEAKSSAAIIGSLPVIVGLLVYLLNPEYMMLLFTETTGNIILGVSAVWMFIGVMIMRGMINFEI
ncbi:type II secretion system F family protein [Rhodobacteraceae bacterium RKSG542]|nr:type II secretion system F family protein [Pseudovibrio flavus]